MEEGVSSSNRSTQRGTQDLSVLAEVLNGPAFMSEKDKGGHPEKRGFNGDIGMNVEMQLRLGTSGLCAPQTAQL